MGGNGIKMTLRKKLLRKAFGWCDRKSENSGSIPTRQDHPTLPLHFTYYCLPYAIE
jgi:hypothetical protein